MPNLIDLIKERREAGTPGPWLWVEEESDAFEWGSVWILGPGVLLADGSDGTPDGDKLDRANAARIASVPAYEEALIAAGELADAIEMSKPWREIDKAIIAFRKSLEVAE